MSTFFPAPDVPYAKEDLSEVSVVAAAVARVRFSPKQAIFSVVAIKDNRCIGFRFVIPKHRKLVREFLLHHNVKQVPNEGYADVTEGMYMVTFHGTIIGHDRVPDEIPEGMPTEVHVVEVKNVSTARIRGPMPEA